MASSSASSTFNLNLDPKTNKKHERKEFVRCHKVLRLLTSSNINFVQISESLVKKSQSSFYSNFDRRERGNVEDALKR